MTLVGADFPEEGFNVPPILHNHHLAFNLQPASSQQSLQPDSVNYVKQRAVQGIVSY